MADHAYQLFVVFVVVILCAGVQQLRTLAHSSPPSLCAGAFDVAEGTGAQQGMAREQYLDACERGIRDLEASQG